MRFPAKNKCTKTISFKVTEEDLEMLHEKSEAAGLTMKDFILTAARKADFEVQFVDKNKEEKRNGSKQR